MMALPDSKATAKKSSTHIIAYFFGVVGALGFGYLVRDERVRNVGRKAAPTTRERHTPA